MNDKEFDLAMKKIIYALKEKGYNPVDQINGYLVFRDSSYITRHNGARGLIETLDRSQIYRYMQSNTIE